MNLVVLDIWSPVFASSNNQLLVFLTFDPILKIPVLLPKFVCSNYDEFSMNIIIGF